MKKIENTSNSQRPASSMALAIIAISCLFGCASPEEPSDASPERTSPQPEGEGTTQAEAPVDAPSDSTPPPPREDEGEGANQDTSGVDMEPACQPSTQCPVDACGVMDDGCGGALDCGACACENGVPATPSCGVCGLGVAACLSEDGDDFSCEQPPIPGLSELDCARLIYVDAGAVAGVERGTREAPFASLRVALELATTRSEAGEAIVILVTAAGEHHLTPGPGLLDTGALRLPEGVSIVGGFTRDFIYDPGAKTRVISSSSTGLILDTLREPFLLEGLDISASEPTDYNRDSYGAVIRNISSSDSALRHVTIRAARASDGLAGADGAQGSHGNPGGRAPTLTIAGNTPGSPGDPGAASGDCPIAAGGEGGSGSSYNSRRGGDRGENAALGTFGGEGGVKNAQTIAARAGEDGSDGRGGEDGEDGEVAAFDEGGIVNQGFVRAGDGGHGQDGVEGAGGGGGGGGAGDRSMGDYAGGSGGGGGAGGCGGGAGMGGRKGGSSIGALLINSLALELEDVRLVANVAGDGGDGGRGSLGGRGAEGGAGTYAARRSDQSPVTHPSPGGAGGAGGDGGDGGHGQGGAGGHSYGAVCDGPYLLDQVALEEGAYGIGGRGGDGVTDAPDGQVAESIGCK